MASSSKSGYSTENHTIVTTDAYILTLTRVVDSSSVNRGPPFKINYDNDDGLVTESRSKPAVLIIHGLCSCGEHWLMNGPDKALPYKLVNEGFDCWLGNLRGAPLSRGEASTGPECYRPKKYWNFSWHEMAQFDIPLMIDYILTTTKNKSLYVVAHSLGSTVFLAGLALQPEYCSKIKVMASLAPAVYATNVENRYFKLLVAFGTFIASSHFLRCQKIMEKTAASYMKTFLSLTRRSSNFGVSLIKTFGVRFGLFGTDQIDEVQMGRIAEVWPVPTSMKVICHGSQVVSSGIFRQYDYGRSANLKLYGQINPPAYDLGRVKVPVATFFSESDQLCTSKDVSLLTNQLPNSIGVHRICHPQFAHIDFAFGKDADKLVYDRVISLFREAEESSSY